MQLSVIGSVVLSATVAFAAWAGSPDSQDSARYNLFNPRPRDQMREWRTDQAGVSPYTIDAGHFEMEATVLSYSYSKRNAKVTFLFPPEPVPATVTRQSWVFGSTVLKAGLLDNLDAEVSLVPYATATTEVWHGWVNSGSSGNPSGTIGDPGSSGGLQANAVPPGWERQTVSGFGDTVGRLKLNLWGNDGGRTALALSGIVKFPTADEGIGNGRFEGGPAIEFAAQLPYGFELRIDSLVVFFTSGHGDLDAGFENLLGLTRPITRRLDGFCVFDTWTYTISNSNWNAAVRAGFTYRFCANAGVFAGSGFGLNGSASDFNPFLGLNFRF